MENVKFNANYTEVSENMARLAKQANSHSEYQVGSATAGQHEYTDRIVEYANKMLEKFPTEDEEKLSKVQEYIDRYSKKIAELIDSMNSIDSRCPSILIAGGSNFQTQKKEKQNQARQNHYEKYSNMYNNDSSNYYFNKIYVLLADKQGIRSDDKDAVQKIKDRIAILETKPDQFGNNKANIRRLKERLLALSPDEVKAGKDITINGVQATYENIISIFNNVKPRLSRYWEEGEEKKYYCETTLVFSDGKRKYNEFISKEVKEDGTELATQGNRENGYKTIWKPLDDRTKFYLIINKISGSGNKAVIYSILRDLDPEVQKAQEKIKQQKENGEQIQKEIKINGENVIVKINEELVRLQLIFEGTPEKQTREILKSNGFKWAPSQKAWQRLLNSNAMRALASITDK